jgi:hypothetical protein
MNPLPDRYARPLPCVRHFEPSRQPQQQLARAYECLTPSGRGTAHADRGAVAASRPHQSRPFSYALVG